MKQERFLSSSIINPMTSAILVNDAQRFLGLAAFILLFIQIILGAFLDKFAKKFGGWVYKFHFGEGIVTYTLIFLHLLFFMVFNHFTGHGWDPYAVFINVCVLCNLPINFYYTLGMVSFWLLTIAVFAAIFRKSNPWVTSNWRKFHIINYVVFLIVGAHAFLIGTDFSKKPFIYFALPAYAIVVGIVLFIETPRLYKNFMGWLNN